METSEEFTVVPKDQRRIIRGKRTKRPRPFAVTSSSSSSGCSGGGKGGGEDVYFSAHSPSENSGCTEEDEDMANCLILLAQSGGGGSKQQMAEDVKKFSSRKFTEMATTGGKAGFNVYECKTCSRSFPSFQALGGHRASHKRPKPLEEKKIVLTSLNDKDDQEREEDVEFNKISQSLSFYKFAQGINSKPKVHECSICGSEFASGQALGGHMRRHRAPTTNPQTTTTSDTNVVVDDQKPRNILQLDLNLPAPEDDHRDSKFPFLFSSPALVGCHY